MKTEQKGRPLPLDDKRRSHFPRRRHPVTVDGRSGGNAGKAVTYERGQTSPLPTRAVKGEFKVEMPRNRVRYIEGQ